jgi:hypothetical protein
MKASDWRKASAVITQMQNELQELQRIHEDNGNNTSGHKWANLERLLVSSRMKLANVAEALVEHTLNASKVPTNTNVSASGSKKSKTKKAKAKKAKVPKKTSAKKTTKKT